MEVSNDSGGPGARIVKLREQGLESRERLAKEPGKPAGASNGDPRLDGVAAKPSTRGRIARPRTLEVLASSDGKRTSKKPLQSRKPRLCEH
eukprot:4459493-Alexandrium_andersonii.AAC.1